MTLQPLTEIEVASLSTKMLLLFLLQTLTNVLLKTSVTGILYVTTPRDLTTALAKMDLKATGKTARGVRFCLRA